MSNFYNEKGEYIAHGNSGTVEKNQAPKHMRILSEFPGIPALRNKGLLELKNEADTLGISIEELVRRYKAGEIT